MTLATSHGSAARPKASRVTSWSSVSWSMAFDRNGCMARLGDTALTRTPAPAASMAAQRVRAITPALAALVLVADGDDSPLLGAPLGGGEPDAGAGRRRDQHRLAGKQPVALRIGRHLAHGRGSGGRSKARSPMMLRWISLDPA